MRSVFASLFLAALALAGSSGRASAIDPKTDAIERVLPGQPIRVLYGGETLQGSFVLNSSDSLLLRIGRPPEKRGFALAEIQGVRVRKSSRGAGMVTGFLLTTVAVVNVRAGDVDALGVAVAGILGGFLGSVVGSAIQRWPQVYPDPKTSAPIAWGPTGERTASVSLRAGYVTNSGGEHANQGFAAGVSVLARNDHAFAIGGELGTYNIPEEDVVVDGARFDGGRTTSITFETRLRPLHGHVRPTLHAGVGPYFDYVKAEYTSPGFAPYVHSEVDWNIGAHIGPGIQVGSGDWSAALEGRWHLVNGSRGDLSSLFTLMAGVTWH